MPLASIHFVFFPVTKVKFYISISLQVCQGDTAEYILDDDESPLALLTAQQNIRGKENHVFLNLNYLHLICVKLL